MNNEKIVLCSNSATSLLPDTPHRSQGETFKWPMGACLTMDNVKLKQEQAKYLVTVPS